jgi:hypothetical protein
MPVCIDNLTLNNIFKDLIFHIFLFLYSKRNVYQLLITFQSSSCFLIEIDNLSLEIFFILRA